VFSNVQKVYIAGYGLTKVGEHWDKSLETLMAESALKALDYTGLSRVDEICVSNVYGEVLQEQLVLGSVLAEELGVSGVPAVRVEAGAASGAAAIRYAVNAIQSGITNVVLVCGGEKLTDGTQEESLSLLSMDERYEVAGEIGSHFFSTAALLYRMYMRRYDVKQDGIASFSVISHENASTVQHAQYPFKIGLENVLNSPYVAEPLHRLETTAQADGAAALVLCSENIARKLDSPKVLVSGIHLATDFPNPFDREDPLHIQSLAASTSSLLSMRGISRGEVSFIELFDAASILAALSLESSGFIPRGKSGEAAMSGRLSLNGELPINTFGGLKARGHPVGATPIYQVAEAYLQLTRQAGKNQLDNVRFGLVESLAGFGSSSVSILLEEV